MHRGTPLYIVEVIFNLVQSGCSFQFKWGLGNNPWESGVGRRESGTGGVCVKSVLFFLSFFLSFFQPQAWGALEVLKVLGFFLSFFRFESHSLICKPVLSILLAC